mgnify:CR=1 FL=1
MIDNKLITFEGIDGSGKSTQINLLNEWFDSLKISRINIREPGGNKVSELIRSVLLDKNNYAFVTLKPAINKLADKYSTKNEENSLLSLIDKIPHRLDLVGFYDQLILICFLLFSHFQKNPHQLHLIFQHLAHSQGGLFPNLCKINDTNMYQHLVVFYL